MVKFLHSSILYYAFSSWIEERMVKTIDCLRENRFVLRAVWKFYQKSNIFSNQPLNSSLSSLFDGFLTHELNSEEVNCDSLVSISW